MPPCLCSYRAPARRCTAKPAASEELAGLAAGSRAPGKGVDFFIWDEIDATPFAALDSDASPELLAQLAQPQAGLLHRHQGQ